MFASDRLIRVIAGICVVLGTLVSGSLCSAKDETDELVGLVIGLLHDKDKDVRALALDQIRTQAQGAAATRKFADQLPKLSPEAQIGLLGALAERNDVAARPAVLTVLSGKALSGRAKTDVQVAAIGALGTLGKPEDAKLFMEIMASGDKPRKTVARNSLAKLRGAEVSRAIAKSLQDFAPEVKVVLIQVLVVRRALDTIPVMLTAAKDTNASVRAAAMTALGQLAGPRHIAGMLQGVLSTKSRSERAAAEKAVMFVCRRIPDAEQRANPILAAMDNLRASEKTAILPTLGRVGGTRALKVVESVIAKSDPHLHAIGVQALCHWPNASVASRLTELAQQDKHSDHRISALRALIRVAPLSDKRTPNQRLELLKKAMAMSTRDKERILVLDRARAVRIPETLRFVHTFLEHEKFAQYACLTVVELAHHRGLREPNKAEFDRALDRVIQISKDPVVIDRAKRYKKGQTWVRPKKRPKS